MRPGPQQAKIAGHAQEKEGQCEGHTDPEFARLAPDLGLARGALDVLGSLSLSSHDDVVSGVLDRLLNGRQAHYARQVLDRDPLAGIVRAG